MPNEMNCEVCHSPDVTPVLDLGLHPLCDDLIPVSDTRKNIEYPIQIVLCHSCLTAHQSVSVPKETLFPRNYHYRSRNTQDVLSGMKSLVEDININVFPLSNKTVLDVGCNDGSLLSIFKEYGAHTFGIDPTNACQEAINLGHNCTQGYFDESFAVNFKACNTSPDLITFTNVFAHIEDLQSLISALKKICDPTKTYLAIENHYLGSILERNQFDTFYHEHPRTYSLNSFVHIADSLNMKIVKYDFPARYGGNIRVLLGPKNTDNLTTSDTTQLHQILEDERHFSQSFKSLNDYISTWKISKNEEISRAVRDYGPLTAKAFPGRSAISIKLLGLDSSHIKCVAEKPGSPKIGHYLPSTNIPIVSDDEVKYDEVEGPILNLAWHIDDEILSYLRLKGFKNSMINII